jgi:short-subunit dehydrogenase
MDYLKKFKLLRYSNRLIYLTGFFTISNYFYKHWQHLNKQKDLNALKQTYGNGWVVITGPTNGIGKEFAEQFSKLGYNLVLISRDQSKLDNLSKSLSDKYGITAKPIQFDFTDCTNIDKVESLRASLNTAIDNQQVSVLINNVGVHYEVHDKFNALNQKQIIDYVSANILSQLTMYNLMLQKLRQQKTKSLIIDVSSQLADIELIAHDVVYQSTKTFNKRFTSSIKRQIYTENMVEGTPDNVDIALVKPGMTYSNLTPNHHKKSAIIDTSRNVVRGALSDIANGYFVTNGSTKHKIMMFGLEMLPEYVSLNYVGPNIYKAGLKNK